MLIIMSGQGLAEIIDWKFCYLALNVFFALLGAVLSQIKTIRGLGIFTVAGTVINVIVMSLTMAGVALYDPVPSQSGHADLSEPMVVAGWVPSYSRGWYQQISGCMLAVFAYGGAMIFTEFMAEMRRPRDFWKAAFGAQFFCYSLYMLFGLFVYSFQGQYTNILPTVNIDSILFQGLTNILGLICVTIIAVMYSHVGCKVFYRNVLRGYFKAPSLTAAKSTGYWSAVVCAYWAVAWVVGSAIPNITDLNTVVGAACILQFTYTFPSALLVGHWVQRDALTGDDKWEPGVAPWSNRLDSWRDASRWRRGFRPYWYAKAALVGRWTKGADPDCPRALRTRAVWARHLLGRPERQGQLPQRADNKFLVPRTRAAHGQVGVVVTVVSSGFVSLGSLIVVGLVDLCEDALSTPFVLAVSRSAPSARARAKSYPAYQLALASPPHSPLKQTNLGAVQVALDGLDDEVYGGERERLERLSVGGGHVSAGDALGRGVEEVERGRLAHLGDDLGPDTKGREAALDRDEVVGLLDGRDDGVDVERADRAEVDDLDLDARLLLESLGGLDRVADGLGVRDDRQVRALPLHLGLAEGNGKVGRHLLLGHGEGGAVEELVLEEADLGSARARDCQRRRGIECGRPIATAAETAHLPLALTGLTSRIDDLRSPLASAALHGETTLRPGIDPYHAA